MMIEFNNEFEYSKKVNHVVGDRSLESNFAVLISRIGKRNQTKYGMLHSTAQKNNIATVTIVRF